MSAIRLPYIIAIICLALLPITALAEDKKPPAGKTIPKEKVMSVESVKLSSASVNGKVKVIAAGNVNTGGWTAPALVATPNAPADGKKHLDFVAIKPAGIVPPVITPIKASTTVQGSAGKFCVVVHAAKGSKEECITVQIGDPK